MGNAELVFLSGGGDVGALMREKDWSGSPLGPPQLWPQSLRSVVGLLLNSKFPMFVAWGPELGFLYNDAYAEILGGKHPAAIGSRFEDIWREIWPDIHPIVEKALAGQSTYHTNLPLTMNRRGYDEQTWFTFSYSPVRDESGAIAGMYCAVKETTSEVLGERRRLDENERLHRLFAQAPSVMAVLRGPQHVFELANNAYLALVGGREVRGLPIRDALPDLAGQGFFEQLDRVYATGEAFSAQAALVRLERADGSPDERYITYIFQPIRDALGEVGGIFVVGNDISAAVRANNELRDAARRKDEFLAMLAHELRNPLAPISAAADLLALAGDDARVARQTGEIIARQVAHMTGLVDDLLDVSRVTRGLVTLQVQPLEIAGVVADAVEQARALFHSRQQHLALHLTSQTAMVSGDRTRLVQVFANLLNNAAKFTPEGGHVEVRVEARQDHVDFSVSDDGLGIAPELLPHVFDLFTQAERSADRAQGGLGLGLALVKRLVELHGGSATARSEGLGRGSRFTVRLPRVANSIAPPWSDAGEGAADTELPPLRLLVVDDNTDAAFSLGLLLEAMGHAVVVEHDAAAALASAQRDPPHIAFLDLGLPDVDGFELARRLRAWPETTETMLVAVTGYGASEDRVRTTAAGFDHHLTKPVRLEVILALLRAHVQPKQLA
jgi:signal transduction histidine kinase/ActR/RegA family two-component response regulator